jgi:hypothetical protein
MVPALLMLVAAKALMPAPALPDTRPPAPPLIWPALRMVAVAS